MLKSGRGLCWTPKIGFKIADKSSFHSIPGASHSKWINLPFLAAERENVRVQCCAEVTLPFSAARQQLKKGGIGYAHESNRGSCRGKYECKADEYTASGL
jgi:hypothetical protein